MGHGEVGNLSAGDGEVLGVETGNELDECSVSGDAGGEGTVGSDSKCGECLEGESGVGGWARRDESRGNGVDLVEVKRSVLRAGPRWALVDGRVEPCLVSGLGGQDGSRNGHVGGLGDGRGGTEVGADTDILDDSGGGNECLGVGHGGREVVGAWLGGSGSKSSREEGDVLCLVLGNVFNSVSDLNRGASVGVSAEDRKGRGDSPSRGIRRS